MNLVKLLSVRKCVLTDCLGDSDWLCMSATSSREHLLLRMPLQKNRVSMHTAVGVLFGCLWESLKTQKHIYLSAHGGTRWKPDFRTDFPLMKYVEVKILTSMERHGGHHEDHPWFVPSLGLHRAVADVPRIRAASAHQGGAEVHISVWARILLLVDSWSDSSFPWDNLAYTRPTLVASFQSCFSNDWRVTKTLRKPSLSWEFFPLFNENAKRDPWHIWMHIISESYMYLVLVFWGQSTKRHKAEFFFATSRNRDQLSGQTRSQFFSLMFHFSVVACMIAVFVHLALFRNVWKSMTICACEGSKRSWRFLFQEATCRHNSTQRAFVSFGQIANF